MKSKRRKARRPEGRIYEHGRWWWSQRMEHGTRVRESTGIPAGEENREAAAEWHRKKIAEAVLRDAPPLPGRVMFADMVELLRVHYVNGRRRSWGRAEYAIARLAERFGKSKAREIDAVALDGYVAARSRDVTLGTVRIELAVLRSMFLLAVRKRRLAADEVPAFPQIAESRPRKGIFEAADFARMVSHLPDHLQDVARFCYLTGVRKAECLGLQWRDVDTAAKVVRLEQTKNGEPRDLAYTRAPELAAIIQRRDEARRDLLRRRGTMTPWLFWHADGKPIRDFRQSWRDACAAAGCPGRLVHDLRRTALTNLVRAGVPEQVAMRISGHRVADVFKRYVIVAQDDVADALSRISATDSATSDRKEGSAGGV